MSEDKRKFVIGIWKRPRESREYRHLWEVRVEVMIRDTSGHDWPCGFGDSWEDKISRDRVRMTFQVSDTGRDEDIRAYRTGPEFRDVYSVSSDHAKRMAAFFAKFEANQRKDESFEHGDVFATFARTVGAVEVCAPRANSKNVFQSYACEGGAWRETPWVWYSVAHGRDVLRRILEELVEMEKIRRGLKEAA